MMDVFDYIRNYCAVRGITKYDCRSKVLIKDDFNATQSFAPGIAFFYRLNVTGTIDNVAAIGSRLLEVTSGSDYYDFSKIINIRDFDTIQQANADFIFTADNMLTLDLKEGVNALFSQIYTAQLFYIYVTVLERANGKSARPRTDVYVEVDNV